MKTHLNIGQRCAQERPRRAESTRRRCTPPENWSLEAHIDSRYREGDRYVVVIGVTHDDCLSHQVHLVSAFANCSVRINPFADASVCSPLTGCVAEGTQMTIPPQTEISIRIYFSGSQDPNCRQYSAQIFFQAEDRVRGFSVGTTLR